jgi:hypothetical protein
MRPIPAAIVEATWKKIAEYPPLYGNKLITQLNKEQPVILAYLLAIGDVELNQDEKELLLYLGMVVWQIMAKGGKAPKVTKEMIDEAEAANFEVLDELTDNFSEKKIAEILQNYNQIEVLKYVIEALMEEPEAGSAIRDEYLGMMMNYLKTVIDCLDR